MDDFWKSKTIAERYEFVEELGRGGIGTVVLARDRTLDKLVAIKILNANLSNEESIRFQQEGILSGKLKHDNIVSVLDFGVTETNVPYLIMEHLQGFSLADMLTADGALEPLFAVRIFQQICRGMRSSHNAGVVHRDLKPANVFMVQLDDETLSAKIVDFGLARLQDENARLTAPGTAIGSPLYMSPEQGQGQPGDERSDIYSMGCLMYKVLTDTTPFEGDTAVLTIMMHQSAKPDKLSTRAGKAFHPMLEDIVAKCLQKQPDDRYQSFFDLLEELEKLEADIVRLEREEELEAGSRSGIQRALGNITDFTTPLASATRKKTSKIGLVILAVAVTVSFGIFLLVPQLIKSVGQQEEDEKTDGVYYTESIDAFRKMKLIKAKGLLTCKAYGENTDEDLAQLKNTQRLDELDLSSSCCVGTGLSALRNTTIVTLNVDKCGVDDKGIQEISKVKGLKKLLIKDCDELTDADFAQLANIKTLQELGFSGTQLTERSFNTLLKLPELFSVQIDEFGVTNNGIAEILRIPKLHSIMFEECKLEDGVIEKLADRKTPFLRVGFVDMTLTPRMVSILKHIHSKYITLYGVKVSKAVYSQILKDPHYIWSDLEVDGKKVADRG